MKTHAFGSHEFVRKIGNEKICAVCEEACNGVARIRRDFPIFSVKVRGKPLVYLDNAATSQKPRQVLDAIGRYYWEFAANVHRGIHALSEQATEAYELGRKKVADFIGAPDVRGIVFTRNATESINLVAHSWGRKFLKPGDEIVLSVLEHHSDIVPWQMAAAATGAVLKFIDLTPELELDMESTRRTIGPKTKIVCVTHVSNGVGTINPVKEIAAMARAVGALCLVDAAQSVPHMPVDVKDIGCDFLVFSAHKMLGPTGMGVLYGKMEILEKMDPFLGGGDMIREVWKDRATWNDLPYKFEAGTPNIAGAIGMGAAVDYLRAVGMQNVRRHEMEMAVHFTRRFTEMKGVKFYGPLDPARRGGICPFSVDGVHAHDIGSILDQDGIAIRAGHHCNQPLMKHLGVPALARASFYIYNTPEEIEALAAGVEKVKKIFKIGK